MDTWQFGIHTSKLKYGYMAAWYPYFKTKVWIDGSLVSILFAVVGVLAQRHHQ
jgi:hypothetical protein